MDRVRGFEVFVQSFKAGEPAGLPRRAVRDAFGAYATESEPNFWRLRYDEVNHCDIYVSAHAGDETLVDGFMVSRPCGDGRLEDALAAILAFGNVVLYFPGCQAPLVARSSVIPHLPPDMVEALGQPVCVTNGNEICHHIESA